MARVLRRGLVMTTLTLQISARKPIRCNPEVDAFTIHAPRNPPDTVGTLRLETKPAVTPQDRRRHLVSHVHEVLCQRRRAVAAEEAAAGPDAPQPAATRATLALFAHACVQARAFYF
jgi:hypothetical protein